MLRKTLIAGAAVLGLAAVSGVAGATPASAGTYLCGPWNGWCSYGHWGHRHHWKGYGHYGWKGHKHNYQAYKGRGYKHYR